jgi:hypothetical protein
MRQHAHLPAMVGFVRKHVAQHFQANRPRPGPAVSLELLDATPATQRFRQHLCAASSARGQSGAGLPRGAVRAIELRRRLQVRSRQPDPLGSDVVHVHEDRRNGAGLAGRFGFPGDWVQMFDENLIHAFISRKDLDCGSAELSANLVLTRGHELVGGLRLQLGDCSLSGLGNRFESVKIRSRIVIQQLAEARHGPSSLEFNQSLDCENPHARIWIAQ